MKLARILATFIFLFASPFSATTRAQHQTQSTPPPQQQGSRDATKEKLRSLLDTTGPKINVEFRQSQQQAYNFVGLLKQGLTNAESFEIVITVSQQETIHFRIFPHYNGSYVNVDKARNGMELMRQMLRFSDQNFLFWGADDSGDIFAGYNFTLESGFPDASIRVVLNSIANLDKFVGQMRPAIDGSRAP